MDRAATRQFVLDFYDAFVNRRDFDSAVRYLGDPYVQHRADIPADLDGLREFCERMRREFPDLRADVRRVFVDGDHVILHVHVVRAPGERGSAHVDIFRVENERIVEHWDVDEPIPAEVVHGNGVV